MIIRDHEIEITCDSCGKTYHKMNAIVAKGMVTVVRVPVHKCKKIIGSEVSV